jgi:hypothetical protein
MLGGLAVSGMNEVEYVENGMAAVDTYAAVGPDSSAATWSLSGADADDFSISAGGELTFNASPDFEMPADSDMDNVYNVTVNANDGTNDAGRSVTITVTNENEPGEITLSPAQPRVGAGLNATLMDPDGGVTNESWQWAREDVGGYTNIPGATSASYTPVEADEGQHLRVTVSYSDATGPQGPLQKQTENAVEAESLLARYDADDSGEIEKEEARAAVTDYFNGVIGKEEAREVIKLYFQAGAS